MNWGYFILTIRRFSILLLVLLSLSGCLKNQLLSLKFDKNSESQDVFLSEESLPKDQQSLSQDEELLPKDRQSSNIHYTNWKIHKLNFEQPNAFQYDGLAFTQVSVLNNCVYLGNTDHFVQYADLKNNSISTHYLPEGDTGKFYRVAKNGYIFIKSLYDRNMNPTDKENMSNKSFQPVSLYDAQVNLITKMNGPIFYENVPPNTEFQGETIFDVSNDLNLFLYAEQYSVLDQKGFQSIKNGLFLYNTSTEKQVQIYSNNVFYYSVKFLPDQNYVFVYYIDDARILHSAILDTVHSQIQLLEQSADAQHHLLLDGRRYIILNKGYYNKNKRLYRVKPAIIPNDTPYIINDDGSMFFFLEEKNNKVQLCIYNENTHTTQFYDLNSEYAEGDIVDISENGTLIMRLTNTEDNSFGLYAVSPND